MENNNIENNTENTENKLNNENIISENNAENNNSEQEKNDVQDAEYTVLDSETDKNFSFFDPVEEEDEDSDGSEKDTNDTDTDTDGDFSDVKTSSEDKIFGDILATLIDGLFSFLIFSVIYSKIEFSENEEKKIMPSERSLKTLKDAWAKLSAYYSWGNKTNPILMVVVATVAVYTASFANASKIAKRKKKNENTNSNSAVASTELFFSEKRGRGRPKGSKNKVSDTENV